MSDLFERLNSANDEFDENMEFAHKGLMGQAANALLARNKEIEALRAERDHYLSSWEESRKYLAIETHHAKQAEARSEEAATALTAKDKEIEALREELESYAALAMKEDDCRKMWQARAETAERRASELASQNTNMRNDLVLAGMARETAERELDTMNNNHRVMAKLLADTARERDEARAALKAVEPYLDAIVCYASSINEHHGNEVAKLVRAVIKQGE